MRALFALGPADPDAERLLRVAVGLEQRGHAISVATLDGVAPRASIPVHDASGDGWWSVLDVGRLLAERDIELGVAEHPRALGVLNWARHLHRATGVSAMGADSVDVAEPELEAVRAHLRGYGRAVFLDRDGTLMPEVGALGRPEAVRLLPGVAPALRALAAARYELVVVSNQSAIGRGAVTEPEVRAVHAALRRALRAEGVELSAIFFCPHRPEDACDCRKPAPGLLLQAAAALELRLGESWMIGDSTRDTEAAARAGTRGILLETGWGGSDPAAPASSGAGGVRARDIQVAARTILRG